MAESHRTARVAERLRLELARILREEVSDPRLATIYVSKTQITSDLQLATVGIRLSPQPNRDEKVDALTRKQALAGFQSAGGRIRTLVAKSLGLRRAPELRYVFDEGLDAQGRVEELLHEIDRDKQQR